MRSAPPKDQEAARYRLQVCVADPPIRGQQVQEPGGGGPGEEGDCGRGLTAEQAHLTVAR